MWDSELYRDCLHLLLLLFASYLCIGFDCALNCVGGGG